MLKRIPITVLLLYALAATSAWAHGGHIHPPSIGRSTHPYLQACIPPYLQIQKALSESLLDNGVKQAAKELAKQAQAGADQESEASGKAMMEGIASGARAISSAVDLKFARDGFRQINKAMLRFFKIWTSHLGEHGLTLFYCANAEQKAREDKIDFSTGWMQKGNKPADPYKGAGATPCPGLQSQQEEE